jgi:hypothetical protein
VGDLAPDAGRPTAGPEPDGGPDRAPRTAPRLKTQPLWIRVDQNRVKLAVFVTAFVSGSALLLTAALVGVPGSLFGLLFTSDEPDYASWYWHDFRMALLIALGVLLALGAIASAVQLANAEDWVRNRFKGTTAKKGTQPALERILEEMAIAAGLLSPPRLVVLDTAAINAYALGTARSKAVVGVTRGLLETMPADEQRAVVATLTARVVSGDIWFASALAALMGPLKAVRGSGRAVGRAIDQGCSSGGCLNGCSGIDVGDVDSCTGCLLDDASDSPGGCLGMVGTFVIVVIIAAITYAAVVGSAWLVTLWGRLLHRTAYEKSDAEGMLLLKDPQPMLAALSRAIASDTTVLEGDASYDGIFYTSTSGRPAIERVEKRRLRRLAEVLGVEGGLAFERAGR